MSPRGKRVTASQVGQYAYCACAWWLGVVEGRQPTNVYAMDEGTGVHERHGWRVSLARGLKNLALVALGIAVLALAAWAIVTLVP